MSVIALDKDPGVRPIGIGEVCRRLIGKAVLTVIKSDILEVTSCLQLCAGQSSACEAIVHAVIHLCHHSNDNEGLFFVDEFNGLNRGLAPRNILYLCPSLGRILLNTYCSDYSLFIEGDTILAR